MEKPTQLILFLNFFFFLAAGQNVSRNTTTVFHVGVILDLGTLVGKIGQTSISMAIDDFYATHSDYTTRLVHHVLDSNNNVLQAASSGNY